MTEYAIRVSYPDGNGTPFVSRSWDELDEAVRTAVRYRRVEGAVVEVVQRSVYYSEWTLVEDPDA